MSRLCAAFGTACILAAGSVASAQPAEPLRGRFEVTVGGQWLGSASLGRKSATLTTGAGAPYDVFSTSSSFAGAAGVEARIGVRLSPHLEAEAFGSLARPAIETAITGDIENAAATIASESVKQFAVGGGLIWYLPARLQSTRLRPFVMGSGAYLRQLHESDTLAVNGASVEIGGGVKYVFFSRRTGRLHSAGIRADARLQAIVRGISFDSGTTYRPIVTASAFLRY